MPFLIAAVVLVGVLCLFDLLLTFAVLRRLREHTAELQRLAGRPGFSSYDPGMLVGHRLPEAARASGATLVAFFDAQCDTCHGNPNAAKTDQAAADCKECHSFHAPGLATCEPNERPLAGFRWTAKEPPRCERKPGAVKVALR